MACRMQPIHSCNATHAMQPMQCNPCNATHAMQPMQCNPCNATHAMQPMQCNLCMTTHAMQYICNSGNPCQAAHAKQPIQCNPCSAAHSVQPKQCNPGSATYAVRAINVVKLMQCNNSKDCFKYSFIPHTISQWNAIPAGEDMPQFKSQIKSIDLCHGSTQY